MRKTDDLTTQEAADLLGVTVGRVQQLIRDGHLRAVKKGRDWFTDLDAIDEARNRPGPGWPLGRPRKQKDGGDDE